MSNDKEHLFYCAFLDFEKCVEALRVLLVVALNPSSSTTSKQRSLIDYKSAYSRSDWFLITLSWLQLQARQPSDTGTRYRNQHDKCLPRDSISDLRPVKEKPLNHVVVEVFEKRTSQFRCMDTCVLLLKFEAILMFTIWERLETVG